jgi:hypothetical protein
MHEPRRPSAEETQVAQARKAKLSAALARKRLLGVAAFLILLGSAVAVAIVGPELIAFSIAAASLIALLQALSAHSHLQVVRERTATSLLPDFSVLQQPHPNSANTVTSKQ